ncbi:MAG: DUF3817 domain-containing protein [Actinomycetota bacterium]|nr:DUF3817 domain-containing protein [Actinomycetota bacterium]
MVRTFKTIAVIEAFTWAGLLVGMYLKYITETTQLGVRVFGSLHGAAFIAYVIITILTARHQKWPIRWTTITALGASIPPFATVIFEMWAQRRGYLRTTGQAKRVNN